jgi:hypothetical protein
LSRKEHVHSAFVVQLPDELAKDFERLNLGIVTHTEGVTIELDLPWSKRFVKVRLEMLKSKRLRI